MVCLRTPVITSGTLTLFNWLSRLGRHRTSQGTGPHRKPAYCLLSKLLSESELVKRLFLTALLASGFNLAYVLRGVNPFYRVSNPSHYLALIQRSLPARPRLA